MKHTLSILLQNEVGALVRVAGLFSARGHNIDSLHVAATSDPAVSHLILTVHGNRARLTQILNQTRKLVDVLEVEHSSVNVDAVDHAAWTRIHSWRELSAYFDHQPEPGTEDGDRFEILATLVEAYETRHFPVEAPDPIDAIRFRMEQAGLTVKDLVPSIGRPNRVYEVLNRKRGLTIGMIRNLHKNLGIPAESLIGAWMVYADEHFRRQRGLSRGQATKGRRRISKYHYWHYTDCMGKLEKSVKSMRKAPQNVRFSDLASVCDH